jgi:hypothetical protein
MFLIRIIIFLTNVAIYLGASLLITKLIKVWYPTKGHSLEVVCLSMFIFAVAFKCQIKQPKDTY